MSALAKLEQLVETIPDIINGINEEEFNKKAKPEKWSKKEILGHLCDSAANNHVRFMKIVLAEEPVHIEGYKQDKLVSMHDYQNNYTKTELAALWKQLNRQICYIMRNASKEDYDKSCILPDGTAVTLGWLFNDYIDHLLHHMKQIQEAA
ncbi:hypothetical protein SD70_01620 [Gordoniibacillus kamchatkensis]|uniref:DinB-like domain-containing protein n=1 Tax=Gordoniibacillus kamchatkensis TaxID=1590651 RepID=A0ABR5AMS2_9BACL|nr:DinB family protein [Paenibacillus sp. VKM B-2647]KIL42260.1 hypothetical protein SD70_01620 [Paenibacillus sp. VKM B-2647]